MHSIMSNPPIVAAIVSGVVTLTMFFLKGIIGSVWDKHFYEYKLKVEHEYEQRKKIKEAISKYKVPLLDSAEVLNHRLWNFSKNCDKGWHVLSRGKTVSDMYYLQSFCYRLLSFLAWCKKFERELIFLDSTLSDEDDLYFVKYVRTMQNIFSDASIFNGTNYNPAYAVDHFFKDELSGMVDFMINDNGVISFSEFKACNSDDYEVISNYLSSIIVSRNCNKWYLLNNFHFVLMAFLSRYGYDFQKTERSKLILLKESQPQNILSGNLKAMIEQGRLNQCKEMNKIIEVLLTH